MYLLKGQHMRRLVIIAATVALIASSAAFAIADDSDVDSEHSDAQVRKAELLADYMLSDDGDEEATKAATEEATEEAVDEIIALRTGDPAIGWGAMFKLIQLAKATDNMTLAELLGSIDGDGWAFGRRFRGLQADQLDDAAKNLGQLKKQAREADSNKSNNGRGNRP